MAASAERLRDRLAILPAIAVLCTCVVLGSGCSRHRVYEVHNLPGQLVAAPTENVEAIDLSSLKTHAVSSELIDRGDVLDVTIVTTFGPTGTTTTPVRVGDDGSGEIPLIGRVPLAGLELEDAEKAIVSAGVHSGVFRKPYVTVTMKRQRVNYITVLGAVKEQGVYPLPRGNSSLLAALVAAGGLTDEAGSDVEIRRPVRAAGRPDLLAPLPAGGNNDGAMLASYHEGSSQSPQTIRVNLASAAKQGDTSYLLDDGDAVMVTKQSPKTIHVMGLVRDPGEYELPLNEDRYVLNALSMAGGRTMQVADTVWVLRLLPGEAERARIRVSVREAKLTGESNIRLAAGDIVTVEETPLTFLMDTMGRFMRIGVSSSLPLF